MADNFDSWPTVTDDDGSLTVGTPFSNAYDAAVRASVADNVYSSTNPTVKTKTIIDEVVDARGNLANIGLRLDGVVDDDGAPVAVAGQASETQVVQAMGQRNWVGNDDLQIWPAGDSAAPSYFALSGAGASVARAGSGLGDTAQKVGPYCAKVTRAAADTYLTQLLMSSSSFSTYGDFFKSRTFGFGAWVKCSVASQARVEFYDGVTLTQSDFHTGGGDWEFLGGLHTVSETASILSVRGAMYNSSGDAYFDGLTAMPSPLELTQWAPCPTVYGFAQLKIKGTVATGDGQDYSMFARPALFKDIALYIITAPTDADLIVDMDVYDGSGWNSPYSTKPQIDATENHNDTDAPPDGTYRYRCFAGGGGANEPGGGGVVVANNLWRFNVDQVGSTEAGQDLFAMLRFMQYARPQEAFLSYDDIGV